MATRNYVEELDYMDAKGLDTTSPINLLGQGFVREALNINLGSTGGYSKRDGYLNMFTQPLVIRSLFPEVLQPDTSMYREAAIRQGFEYRNSTGFAEILLYATNDKNTGKFGKVSGNTFTPLKRWDTDSAAEVTLEVSPFNRPSLVQFGNGLYYFDGYGGIGDARTPFVYEGNTTFVRTLGIAPPRNPLNPNELFKPTSGTPGAGGKLTNGQYLYAFTYAYFKVSPEGEYRLIAESSPSDISDAVTVSDDHQVQINLLPLAAYGVDLSISHFDVVIRTWRTVANGNILFLEDEIAANSSSYISSKSDNELGTEQMPIDNTQLDVYEDYQKARFPLVVRNRLMVFHPSENRGRFSKIGLTGPLPESFPVQNEFSVEGKFGSADAVVGAGQIKGIPIVFKERSIGRLDEVGIPDLGNSVDNVTYIYREISETVGGVAHFAQCQVFDELVFLGRDNIYATDGQNLRPIGMQIQTTIKSLDLRTTKIQQISAINDTKNKRVYFQVFDNTGATVPNLTLVGDYQQYPTFRWTTYDAGDNVDLYPGIKAGCFFQTEAIATGGLDIYFGSATYEGMYYKMNTGEVDYFWDAGDELNTPAWSSAVQYNPNDIVEYNSQLYKCLSQHTNITPGTDPTKWVLTPPPYPIYMRLVTRPYMFGQPLIQKLYKSAKIFVEARDPSYDFQFGAKFDLDDTVLNTKSFVVPGVGTVWGPPLAGQIDYAWYYSTDEVQKYTLLTGLTPPAPATDDYLYFSGPALKEYIYNLHKKSRMMQLVFIQDDRNAPISLLGWGVSGSIFSGI